MTKQRSGDECKLRKIRGNEIKLSKFAIGIFAISLLLSFLLFPYQVYSANNNIIFPDVSEKWQKDAIYSAVDRGIVHGYEDGTFKPNQKITEAEFAVMLVNSATGIDVRSVRPGKDDHWAQSVYDELGKYGLPLLGYQDTLYKDSPLSRGRAAKIIARIYGFDLNVVEAVDFMYENDLSKDTGEKMDFESYGAFAFLTRSESTLILDAMYHKKQVTFKRIPSNVSNGKISTEVLYRSKDLPVNAEPGTNGRYALFQGRTCISSSEDMSLAEQNGRQYTNAYLIDQKSKSLVWSNFDNEIEFTESTNQGNLFLINHNYPVAEEYKANKMLNLADYTSNCLRVSANDMYIDEVVFNPLQSMLNDIYADGADKLVLISTYRSYQTQTMLFQNRVDAIVSSLGLENAEKQVAASTAVPGSSEHQTGLAIDFSTLNYMTLTQAFANSNEGHWLTNNSWKYGFVVRYAMDKMSITGIIYEPWHLRYVGVPHAEIMYKSGLCLEEYMDYICREQMLYFSDYQGYTHQIYFFNSINSEDLLSFLYLSDRINSISGDGKGGIIVTTS